MHTFKKFQDRLTKIQTILAENEMKNQNVFFTVDLNSPPPDVAGGGSFDKILMQIVKPGKSLPKADFQILINTNHQ